MELLIPLLDRIHFHSKILTEIGPFSVANPFGSGNHAIIWLARRIILAIYTGVKIDPAVGANSPKADLHRLIIYIFCTLPTFHFKFYAHALRVHGLLEAEQGAAAVLLGLLEGGMCYAHALPAHVEVAVLLGLREGRGAYAHALQAHGWVFAWKLLHQNGVHKIYGAADWCLQRSGTLRAQRRRWVSRKGETRTTHLRGAMRNRPQRKEQNLSLQAKRLLWE